MEIASCFLKKIFAKKITKHRGRKEMIKIMIGG
jgi:hypothetical protein